MNPLAKTTLSLAAAAATFLLSNPAAAQMKLPRPSPTATVSQMVGVTDVAITYSRPSVKGRKVWGELVPFDKVWRTGANEATIIKFSTPVKVNGKPLAAGTYSLHSTPSKDEWTVIFNTVADQWGSYSYDAAKDALRVKVRPEAAEFVEMLSFSFPRVSADSATLALRWERTLVPIMISAATRAETMAGLRESLPKAKADDWRSSFQAARYALEPGGDREQGMRWLDQSIAINPTYQNTLLKAETLAKNGDHAGAIVSAERAIELGKTAKADTTGAEAMLTKWKSKK
ncbi:MAG TPA: DUF2911 domain-containing protein [Thermoanaerobaculia bacterium]|nr:DUF2911 domain-containing protein [Thermoanaerobaculia bacterium]